MQIRADQTKEDEVPCGCGRSPTGKCIGWHGLSEEMYAHQQMLWMEDQMRRDAELEEYRKEAEALWFQGGSCTGGKPE